MLTTIGPMLGAARSVRITRTSIGTPRDRDQRAVSLPLRLRRDRPRAPPRLPASTSAVKRRRVASAAAGLTPT